MTLSEGHTSMPSFPLFNIADTQWWKYIQTQFPALFNLLTASQKDALDDPEAAEAITLASLENQAIDQE